MQDFVGGRNDNGTRVPAGIGLAAVDQSQRRCLQLLPTASLAVVRDQADGILASGQDDVPLRPFPEDVGISCDDGLADGVRQGAGEGGRISASDPAGELVTGG